MSNLWKAESPDFDNTDWQQDTTDFTVLAEHYLPDESECRQCGICVNTCSSYQLDPCYEESPRGRVALLRQSQFEQRTLHPEQQAHLDTCLQCRQCETVCPSHMDYQYWYDRTQQQSLTTTKPPQLARIGFWLIAHKRWRKALLPAMLIFQGSGLLSILQRTTLLKRLGLESANAYRLTPSLSELATIYPVKKTRYQGRVALFTGCLAEHFDRETLLASIKVLNHIGFEVVVPHEQACCGALHQHHGLSAEQMMEQNIRTFYGLEISAVIFAASGCGAMLKEYPDTSSEMGGWFHRYLFDIHDFLLQHWPKHLELAASNLKVAVHEPCSQRNVLKNSENIYQLLAKIPGLIVEQVRNQQLCCGAGGTYMLRHPDNASQLRTLKWESIAELKPDLVVSTNFGCALHMNTGDFMNGLKMVHTVRLLADRL